MKRILRRATLLLTGMLVLVSASEIKAAEGEPVIADGKYHIASSLDLNQTLDVAGALKEDGANIQLYASADSAEQVFEVSSLGDGYYKITNTNSGKCLDIAGASTEDGANVQQYEWNGGDNQQWIIQDAGDGCYYIISKWSGKYLDAAGGQSSDGTNVQVWEGNQGAGQKWKFLAWGADDGQTIADGKYHIASSLDTDQTLNVAGDSQENSANIQLYGSLGDTKQLFQVTYLGNGYYKIANTNSGKYLDVAGGTGAAGSNVHQYEWSGDLNQQWIIRDAGDGYYYIVSKLNGMYLDVAGGQSTDGTNVQVWMGNQSAGQKWKFVEPDTKIPVFAMRPFSTRSHFIGTTMTGFTVTAHVTDESGIDRVQFKVWTLANGQDDLLPDWETNENAAGKKEGDSYSYQIKFADHSNKMGSYRVDVYAWDIFGNCAFLQSSYSDLGGLSYGDVSESDWFYDGVWYNTYAQLMNGIDYHQYSFGPKKTISRSQFATILYRMEGLPEVEYKDTFSDVPEGQWYTDAVLWANEQGIIIGYGNGNFGPTEDVTREQMAAMLFRYARYKEYDTGPRAELKDFTDGQDVSAFASEAMEWAVGAQIISGRTNGTLLVSHGNVNRAECAVMTMRFADAHLGEYETTEWR